MLSQTQEAVYYLFILHSRKGKAVGTENKSVGARVQGGVRTYCKETGTFEGDENIL